MPLPSHWVGTIEGCYLMHLRLCKSFVVLASLSDEALSDNPTRLRSADGRTEKLPPDPMFLFPRPLSHLARAEPDALKE